MTNSEAAARLMDRAAQLVALATQMVALAKHLAENAPPYPKGARPCRVCGYAFPGDEDITICAGCARRMAESVGADAGDEEETQYSHGVDDEPKAWEAVPNA